MTYQEEYQSKLKTAEEAVQVVKSGDWVEYGAFAGQAYALDAALAGRAEELEDVKIRGCCTTMPPQVIAVDPDGKHFNYSSFHFSGLERKLGQKAQAFFVPMLFHEYPRYYRQELNHGEVKSNVVFIPVAAMDDSGYFNFGPEASHFHAMVEAADTVIVEVNASMPVCYGGYGENVHISDVDIIVENDRPLDEVPPANFGEIDKKVAEFVMGELFDGACIQLGIGGMPNAIGKMISESDLKDLGIHSEMFTDSMVDMVLSGRVTGKRKNINPGKHVYTFAMGTKRCYDFLDKNTSCAIFPVDYTNDPFVVGSIDNFIAINNCLEMDLYGQASSEAAGIKQISGTGGQADFMLGAYRSKGGKAIMALSSTVKMKDGTVKSRIRPTFDPYTIVTTPRSMMNYVATEYGIVNLKARSTWQRAEALISIAHPDFREELIQEAEKMNIWRKSNKR